jgi:hypothetical protein
MKWLLGVLLVLSHAAVHADQAWEFADPAEVRDLRNLHAAQVTGGMLCGMTEWDPYFWLVLPEDGVDARLLSCVTMRLYSSAPADHVAVYYKSPNGEWGLGKSLPVVEGWATYRLDMTEANWGESGGGAGARQWGGSTGKVISFRIDPGNEAGRWIMVDSVRLHGKEAGFTPGVQAETAGAGVLEGLRVSPRVNAGQPIEVDATLRVERPGGGPTPAFIWLFQGETLVRWRSLHAETGTGRVALREAFATSPYAFPAQFRVRVGIPGVTIPGVGLDSEGTQVAFANPRAGKVKPPAVTVKRIGGDPAILLEGKPIAPFFVGSNDRDRIGRHKEFAGYDLHLYSDWLAGSSTAGMLGQVKPGVYDYSVFDTYFAEVLEADPDAYFLPHVNLTAPLWWQKAHPEELCTYADGGKGPQSFASERWRRDTAEDLRRFLRHVREAPYADRILGYILYTGYSAEWQSWGLWQNKLADYSAPAVRAWREWLKATYGSDAALRKAWGREDVALASALPPSPDERHGAAWGALRDPVRERHVIDYYRFLAELTAEDICYFARVAKGAGAGESLIGTYYGYLTQHGVRQQDSSHLALSRVLRCPEIDFLMSPPLYSDRHVGGTSGFMSATESVRLHGKVWLSEADYRTHLTDPAAGFGRASTLAESRAVLLREMGNVLARRAAVSWYDMGAGWLGDPGLLTDLRRMQAIQQDSLSRRTPFHGDVAVFIDEESFFYLRAMHPINMQMVLQQVTALPRIGAAWDLYLLSDIEHAGLPPYKLYIFLNAARVSEALRASIRSRLARERATALWIYAPGFYGDAACGEEQVAALTGIRVRRDPGGKAVWLGDPEKPLAGCATPVEPLFVVEDPDAQTLATLHAKQAVGLARKLQEGWTSIFCAAPTLRPDLLRRIAREAGCHLYCESGDAISVDSRFLCIHAAEAGEKRLRWPKPGDVTDALTGERLATRVESLTLPMQRGETRLLIHEPAR